MITALPGEAKEDDEFGHVPFSLRSSHVLTTSLVHALWTLMSRMWINVWEKPFKMLYYVFSKSKFQIQSICAWNISIESRFMHKPSKLKLIHRWKWFTLFWENSWKISNWKLCRIYIYIYIYISMIFYLGVQNSSNHIAWFVWQAFADFTLRMSVIRYYFLLPFLFLFFISFNKLLSAQNATNYCRNTLLALH